jgi:putative membrane protein
VGTSGTASAADREFVDAQVTMTRKEAGLARLAQERAANAQVKELASRVAMESQRTGEQLEQLAGKSGMQLTTAEGEQLREERDRLSKLSGREFDREYVTEVIADLERVVRDLEAKADSGNADLRDWASKAVAGWKTHLEEARRLKGTIGA